MGSGKWEVESWKEGGSDVSGGGVNEGSCECKASGATLDSQIYLAGTTNTL